VTAPPPPSAPPRAVIVLVVAAAITVVAAGVQATAWLIGPAFLALVIVIVVRPVDRWLRRVGAPGWLSTAVLLLLVYAVVLVLAGVLLVSASRLATLLPQYASSANALVGAGTRALSELGVGPEQLRGLAGELDLRKIIALIGGLLAGLAGLAANLVFLLSLVLFLCIESSGAGARMAAIGRDRPHIAEALGRFAAGTRRFLVVTTIFGLGLAVLDTIALVLLGIPLAVLWGLLSFITNYIPYIGFFLGVLPPAILALLAGGWQLMLIVIGVYTVLNFVVTSLVQPHFIGDAVDLSVTITFIGLVFWGWLLGPVGAVLAIPLTLLAKALLVDTDPRAAWADALLCSSAGVRVDPAARGDAGQVSPAADEVEHRRDAAPFSP
jgi:predicted PurR-regulated permease PerM